MFEHLAKFDRILVTGPQRSGTNICARMIAHDTGMDFVPPHAIGIGDVGKFRKLFDVRHHFVLHGPTMCRYAHEVGCRQDNAVVLMRRPLDEIVASRKRIKWEGGADEAYRYMGTSVWSIPALKCLWDNNPPEVASIFIKYWYWEHYQKPFIFNPFEVEYHDLESHPLWVPAELRKDFAAHQWAIDWEPY